MSLALCGSACGGTGPGTQLPSPLRPPRGHALPDATVHGARMVPESVDLSTATVEPSGSVRGIVQGTRFRVESHGTILTGDGRIEDTAVVITLPPRLGGGFLFVVGDTVLRADDWLARTRPIFRSSRGITDAFVGLDRVYLRTKVGSHIALDPRTGSLLDVGPWPRDPVVGSYVALDGWRALALTDLRGAVATSDAGRTWTKLDLPILPQTIAPVRRTLDGRGWVQVGSDLPPEGLVLSDAPLRAATTQSAPGAQAAATPRCYLVSDDFVVSPLSSCGDVAVRAATSAPSVDSATLRAALLDGWPLDDATALVASGPDLLRVSLADGAVVETAAGAFGADPGPCHAISLASPATPAAVGFVCGVSRGPTTLFRYDDASGRIEPARRFASARVVQASGNGAWLVQGPCAEGEATSTVAYCVGVPAARERLATAWHDVATDGLESAAAVLSDGSVARIVMEAGLESAHLVSTSPRGETVAVKLHLDELPEATRAFLEKGVWVRALEERTLGVLGGWVLADGTAVGVEVEPDGTVRAGEHVRDLGSPYVAGRYGIGWTRSHQGFETTDGGFSWKHFEAPVPLAPPKVRSCGPAGCVLDGWLRVGWGERLTETTPLRPEPPLRNQAAPPFWLTCKSTEPLAHPSSAAPRAGPESVMTSRIGHGHALTALSLPPPRSARAWFTAPRLTKAEELVQADVLLSELTPGYREAIGRVQAWGPAVGDWSSLGHLVTRWRSPFWGLRVSSSAIVAPPFLDAEHARLELGPGHGASGPPLTASVSEDGIHLLLATRRSGRAVELTALDAGGAALSVRRADGAEWTVPNAALRIDATWYIVMADAGRRTIELLRVDADVARVVATLERLSLGAPGGAVRLARSDLGDTIGIVLEGEPPPDRAVPRRWVVPVDLDSGAVLVPEPVGVADLSDRRDISICADHGGGWVLDAPWPNANVRVDFGTAEHAQYLQRVYVRVRLSADRACVEELSGDAGEDAGPSTQPGLVRVDSPAITSLSVSLRHGGAREPTLARCTRAQK